MLEIKVLRPLFSANLQRNRRKIMTLWLSAKSKNSNKTKEWGVSVLQRFTVQLFAGTPVSRGVFYLERKASFLFWLPDLRFLGNNLSVFPEGSWEGRVLVFHSHIRGCKGRSRGQSHQAADMKWRPQHYDTQCLTHRDGRWCDSADTLSGEKDRDAGRNLVRAVPSSPWTKRASAGDWSDLTLDQVSWPCGGHWNKIFLSSSLSTGKKYQRALYSLGTVESILTKKILPLSHLSPFSSTPRPHNQPCVVTPGLELHSPCVQLWTIHKATRRRDPAHFSHTVSVQFYWIRCDFSPVIDVPPDAFEENALLTRVYFVFASNLSRLSWMRPLALEDVWIDAGVRFLLSCENSAAQGIWWCQNPSG